MRNVQSKKNRFSSNEVFWRWHELEFPFKQELLLDNSLNFNPILYNSTDEDLGNILYFNKNGYRCDEFIKDHAKKHILFSGDSQTYGTGLLKEETWAYKLYQKLNQEGELSGYFNIAEPGMGIPAIVYNIFLYCKKYGNPDVIFINLTTQPRGIRYDKRDGKYYHTIASEENLEDFVLSNYQHYFMLEQYCLSNNIKLYSFTWQTHSGTAYLDTILSGKPVHSSVTNDHFSNLGLTSFYGINPVGLKKKIRKNYNVGDKYFITARDNLHLGTGFHDFWNNFMYEIYLNDNSRN